MKLSKIRLRNYRCFGEGEQVILIDDLVTFIGNNSAGKSAALCALNCIFSENANDRVLKRSDFHLPKDKKPEELMQQEMYIEAVFTFEELEDEHGKKYAVPQFFESLVVDEPKGTPYLRVRLMATWETSTTIEGAIDSKVVYVTCSEEQEITDDDIIIAPRRDLDRIRLIYVPAVREPAKQLKNVSGTMMHHIMSSINWSNITKQNVTTKIQELNAQFMGEKGVSILGNSIKTQWKEYDTDARYSNAELHFNSTDLDSSIKKSEIVFQPTVTGKEYNVEEMGDGLRSLFYISMVDSILDVENTIRKEIEDNPDNLSFSRIPPILTIIAVEEPENHISPHLIGKLIENLKNTAIRSNAQTILTSHSPAIIKRVEPECIRYFRMNVATESTEVRKITFPDKEKFEDQYKYIKEAVKAYPELYFAKLVILGEGDSEEILLSKFFECCGKNIDISGISIVPLGGRHVNHFWRLLNDLHIPHITLLDLDREREGGGWGRIKYVLKQLIANGYSKDELLKLQSGKVLTDDELEAMSNWKVNDEKIMQKWIDFLEKYNVFFSAPLDVDFLMLENFETDYKGLLEGNEGPRILVEIDRKKEQQKIIEIEELDEKPDEYTKRVEEDIRNTLKKEGGDGSTYTEEQKRLMIWYNYLFLNRGKPSTHILALSKLDDLDLLFNLPSVFGRLIKVADKLLNNQ
ncbi:MAG: AAA family ATPase [Lachnospiraceae bacterium]|nr:AAA family ATPase [Lachnospiraceae bacterium]